MRDISVTLYYYVIYGVGMNMHIKSSQTINFYQNIFHSWNLTTQMNVSNTIPTIKQLSISAQL